MNFPVVLTLLGHVIKYEMLLLFIPLFISLYYGQGDAKAFLITIFRAASILPFNTYFLYFLYHRF